MRGDRIVVAVFVVTLVAGVGYYAGRPTVLDVVWGDTWDADLRSEGVTAAYLVTRGLDGREVLVHVNESGQYEGGHTELVGFAFEREQNAVFDGFNETAAVTHLTNVSQYYNDTFSRTLSDYFSYDWKDDYRGVLNVSFHQNFSDYVTSNYSRYVSTNFTDSIPFRVYNETVTATLDITNGTPKQSYLLTHWIDFVPTATDVPYHQKNLSKINVEVTGGSSARTAGYLTLTDSSAAAKTLVVSKDSFAGSDRYLRTDKGWNASIPLRFEIKWKLASAAGTDKGAMLLIEEYNAVTGGSGVGGATIVKNDNFDWRTDTVDVTPNAATKSIQFIAMVGAAWNNAPTGVLDVEYVKIYQNRWHYNLNQSWTALSMTSCPEHGNASWTLVGSSVNATVNIVGGKSNRLDYDYDSLTFDGSTQATAHSTRNLSVWTYAAFAVGYDGASTDAFGPDSSTSANSYSFSISGEGSLGSSDGDNVTVTASYCSLTVNESVEVTTVTTVVYRQLGVAYDWWINNSFSSWVEGSVGSWLNNSAAVQFDVAGTGNYSYYDLSTNATASAEISFILTNLTSTVIENLFTAVVTNNVNWTATFTDTVTVTTNVTVTGAVTADTYAYSVITSTRVTTVTSGSGWTEEVTTTTTTVTTFRREFVVVDVTPTTIGFPSWNRRYLLTLDSLDTSAWDVGFDLQIVGVND